MGERLSVFWGRVRDAWSRTAKKMRILILGGLACVLILALAVVLIYNHTDYIVLYNNLTVEENAGVLAQLQEMGVEGVLEGNSILVPAAQESTVRMQLAMRGVSAGGRYDTFALGSGLTSTQFDKDFYSAAQKAEEIENAIRTFPEVKSVQAIVTLPENSVFTLQSEIKEPSVAVRIEKMPGRTLNAEQVRGILNLVRTSVPGLTEDNISLVDENGDMSLNIDFGDVSTTKLRLTEMVNRTLEARVLGMLLPVYGDGNVVVKANTVLDTDDTKITRTIFSPVDPDNPDRQYADYIETELERTTEGPVVQGVPGANDNIGVPEYAAEVVDDGEGTYFHSHNIYDYLLNSEVQEIQNAGLTITDATVSVLVNSNDWDATRIRDWDNIERGQVMNMAATAGGIFDENGNINENRISVQSMDFHVADVLIEPVISGLPIPLPLLIALILLLLAAIIITVVALSARAKKRAAQLAAENAYLAESESASLAELLAEREDEFEPIMLAETQEQKLKAQIKELANSDPEIVASLIKTWLINA